MKKIIYLLPLFFIFLNVSDAKSQCNCDFEYEITAEPVNGVSNIYDITIDIQTNGIYSIEGIFTDENYEVCYSEHPNDTNYNNPIYLIGQATDYIDFIITNLDSGCAEEILDVYLPYPTFTQNIASCDGCSVHQCDLWVDVKSDRFNVYKYPHQGCYTILLYRIKGSGTAFSQKGTKGHYYKVPTEPCNIYELNYIKYCPGEGWSNWTGWFDVASSCPKIGGYSLDEFSKLGSKNNIDINFKVEVFPNPSNGNISLTSSNFKELDEGVIEIFDLSGKLVSTDNLDFEGNTAKINLRNNSLTNGIYFTKIISGLNVFTTEIIIEK